MGYTTHYSLSCDELRPEELARIKERKVDGDYTKLGELSDADEMRWYDHEEEMAIVSKEFPNVTFRLTGQGEECMDSWVKWFLNGAKIAEINAEMPPDPIVSVAYKMVSA